jgi:peptidoglycan/LPS O-acetylase OafA/YrhL
MKPSLTPPSTHSIEVNTLKAIASLLIINSHLEHLYPKPWMALDGLLGNTLFFFTTGFTLSGSLSRTSAPSFLRFLFQRLIRMYPALWIVVLAFHWASLDFASVPSLINLLIYPTSFSFVAAIVPLYPLFYFLLRLTRRPTLVPIAGLTFVALSYAFATSFIHQMGPVPVRWNELGILTFSPYFFGAMILGATFQRAHPPKVRISHLQMLLLFTLLISSYFFLRFAASSAAPYAVSTTLRPLLSLSLPLCITAIICGYLMLSHFPKLNFTAFPPLASAIRFLSKYSWETYLLHLAISHWAFIKACSFPFNVLAVFFVTFCFAPLLDKFSSALRSRLSFAFTPR